MPDQKIENLLELSLDTPENMREKSENLSAGYNPVDEEWEVIIRYSGDIDMLRGEFTQVTELLGGYAIVVLPESQIRVLANNPQVEYVEKPKALSFTIYEGKQASCILPVQRAPYNLSGSGILVAVVDSGIDIFHPDFQKEDGTTRIVGIWDQTITAGNPPMKYPIGTFYSEEEINQALRGEIQIPSRDGSGHGTHVTGIAAGNGRASRGEQRGVAYEADILVVKLRARTENSFPQTTELMMGIDFCVRIAVETGQPLALNLSYGNSYGSHDGTSLIETYLDMVAGLGRTTICIGSGNEGNKSRHTSGNLSDGNAKQLEFVVAPGEYSLSIQLWKSFVDDFQVILQAPSGANAVMTEQSQGAYRYILDGTEILWYFGEPSPYSINQEIYIEMIPEGVQNNIRSGVWKLILIPVRGDRGEYQLWMPAGNSISDETGFLIPSTQKTLTIPSTADKVITVGAYDSKADIPASFSGQGYVCCDRSKPDLIAPGVNIISCAPGGGYTTKSGTSMACPFVTGSAALLMEFGILRGLDPYLYGEKVKAYLIKGARPIVGEQYGVPNTLEGWGALCLRDSLPL